jgi:hypothetical protein
MTEEEEDNEEDDDMGLMITPPVDVVVARMEQVRLISKEITPGITEERYDLLRKAAFVLLDSCDLTKQHPLEIPSNPNMRLN